MLVDAVAGRLSAPLAGAQITLGGQSIDLSRTGDSTVLADAMIGLARAFGAPGGAAASGVTAPGAWPDRYGGAWDSPAASGGSPVRSVTGRELLLGSSFHLALGGGGGTGLSAWGRATVGGFDGQGEAETGAMRMDGGEVITGILGADVQRGRWLAGLALSVSEGEGTFEQPEAGHRGTIESNMTSLNPYLRFEASERLSTWGLLGFGTGEMTITEAARGERGETVTRTGIEMRLAAVGARGALLDAATSGGFDLAVKADAFLVETEWEKVSNERDTQAGASRVRLVLEGSRAFELSESANLTPGLELGLRHDGGDGETGTGVEVGGSVRYADAASGFKEWGASASVRLDPGAEGRGLSHPLFQRFRIFQDVGSLRVREGLSERPLRLDERDHVVLALASCVGAGSGGIVPFETLSGTSAGDLFPSGYATRLMRIGSSRDTHPKTGQNRGTSRPIWHYAALRGTRVPPTSSGAPPLS